MKRTLVFVALFGLSAPTTLASRCRAQSSATVPVIRPTITELGEIRDSTLAASYMPYESALSPRGNLIVYNTDTDLRLWNATTRSTTVLLKGWSESMSWSPRGDAIAFAHQSEQGSDEHIWTIRLDATSGAPLGPAQRVTLSATTAFAPQFSPDGKQIAISRIEAGQRTALAILPANGGAERVLATGLGIRRLRWAEDGTSIYYTAYTDTTATTATMHRVALNGGKNELVGRFTGAEPPSMTIDTRSLMLSPPPNGNTNETTIADLAGKPRARIVFPNDVQVADWSGRQRLGGFRELTPRGLRVYDLETSKGRDVIDSTADVQAAAWFRDNRRLAAVAMYPSGPTLVTVNVDGSSTRKVPLSVYPFRTRMTGGPIGEMSVSPDGNYAVYLGDDRRSLELVELSTGKQRTLARSTFLATPMWSDDSKSIRYLEIAQFPITNNNRSIRDVTLDGTVRSVRTLPVSDYPNVAWLIDRNHVTAFGGSNHVLISLGGGADRVMSRVPIQGAGYLSPDGQTIALRGGKVRSNEPARKITLVSVADGQQRNLDLPFSDIGVMHFTPDGKRILIRGRERAGGSMTIYSVPLDGSRPRSIATVDTKDLNGLFDQSPDGKFVFHTIAGARRAAFVAIDFSEGLSRIASARTP